MSKFVGLVVKIEKADKGPVGKAIEVEEGKGGGKKTAARSSSGVKKE